MDGLEKELLDESLQNDYQPNNQIDQSRGWNSLFDLFVRILVWILPFFAKKENNEQA